jgi:hypothetical protein
MARRAGKAASRKARQRSDQQRSAQRASRPASPAVPPPSSAGSDLAVPPVGTPDARQAISLDPPQRSRPVASTAPGSTLTTRERAEYHYVERDLRNIGVLTAVMVALLLLAWALFSALNLTG